MPQYNGAERKIYLRRSVFWLRSGPQWVDLWCFKCVDVPEGEVPFGGVDMIGSVGSFYVSVNGRMGDPEGGTFLGLANLTLEARSDMAYETE